MKNGWGLEASFVDSSFLTSIRIVEPSHRWSTSIVGCKCNDCVVRQPLFLQSLVDASNAIIQGRDHTTIGLSSPVLHLLAAGPLQVFVRGLEWIVGCRVTQMHESWFFGSRPPLDDIFSFSCEQVGGILFGLMVQVGIIEPVRLVVTVPVHHATVDDFLGEVVVGRANQAIKGVKSTLRWSHSWFHPIEDFIRPLLSVERLFGRFGKVDSPLAHKVGGISPPLKLVPNGLVLWVQGSSFDGGKRVPKLVRQSTRHQSGTRGTAHQVGKGIGHLDGVRVVREGIEMGCFDRRHSAVETPSRIGNIGHAQVIRQNDDHIGWFILGGPNATAMAAKR